MIKEFLKGQHSNDVGLEEEYLDWFFLHYFNQPPNYWRELDDDRLMSLITIENEKEKQHWENWGKMLSKLFGGK